MRIKELRTEKDLTQEAVAYKAEVDRTYITILKQAKEIFPLQLLKK